MFNVIDLDTGWKVDVICLRAGAFPETEFSRRITIELFGTQAFVATAEDTVLAKLLWALDSSSERQMRDAAGIVRASGDGLDLDYINGWAAELGVAELWRKVSGAESKDV